MDLLLFRVCVQLRRFIREKQTRWRAFITVRGYASGRHRFSRAAFFKQRFQLPRGRIIITCVHTPAHYVRVCSTKRFTITTTFRTQLVKITFSRIFFFYDSSLVYRVPPRFPSVRVDRSKTDRKMFRCRRGRRLTAVKFVLNFVFSAVVGKRASTVIPCTVSPRISGSLTSSEIVLRHAS